MALRVVLISLSLLEKEPFDNDPLKNHSIETEEKMISSLDTCSTNNLDILSQNTTLLTKILDTSVTDSLNTY